MRPSPVHLSGWGALVAVAGAAPLAVAILAPTRLLLTGAHFLAGAVLLVMAASPGITSGWMGSLGVGSLAVGTLAIPFVTRSEHSSRASLPTDQCPKAGHPRRPGLICSPSWRRPSPARAASSYSSRLACSRRQSTTASSASCFRSARYCWPAGSSWFWWSGGQLAGWFTRWRTGSWRGASYFCWFSSRSPIVSGPASPTTPSAAACWASGPGWAGASGPQATNLRARLGLALALAAAVPLVLAVAVGANREEQWIISEVLASNRDLATAAAADVGDYADHYRTAAAAVAGRRGLLDLPTDELRRVLGETQPATPTPWPSASTAPTAR